jgi:hypothetical protein
LWETGLLDEAILYSKKLIDNFKNDVRGYILLGSLLRESGDFANSQLIHEEAFKYFEPTAELYHSFALTLKERMRFPEALEAYDNALVRAENNPEIRNNRAILLLLSGNYKDGFREYEWRKYTVKRYGYREFSPPLWCGQELNGKTLLIHHEQGLGDAIQFSRYVKILYDNGVDIRYAAHPSLMRLLGSMGDLAFADLDKPTCEFDYHCPLLSLPLRFGTVLETIPDVGPYLFAETNSIDKWHKKIGLNGFKIGVAWRGGGGRFAGNRSLPNCYFKRLLDFPNVRLISLHKASINDYMDTSNCDGIEFLGPDVDEGPDSFIDTAAIIKICDLVISCDTSIAHLAGALGKSTWLVLRHVPHWVWMMDKNVSPWYSSIRLFRQKSPGDWASAFSDVYREFSLLIESNK